MQGNQFALLGRRRFLPLFVTQFLGALNDNVFKQALVILVSFRLAEAAGLNAQIMVTLAAGIFIVAPTRRQTGPARRRAPRGGR